MLTIEKKLADKNTAAIIAFFFGFLGLHIIYLKKPWWQAALYLLASAIGIPAMIYLYQHDWQYGAMWYVSLFFIASYLAGLIASLCYALFSTHRWLRYMNLDAHAQNMQKPEHQITSAGVFCAIMTLMLMTGVLVSYIALGFQRYFESVTL